MATYVRVRNSDTLREAVSRTGSQRQVADLVGMSAARLNQLLVGVRPCLRVHQANALATMCRVAPGELFEVEHAEQLAPYFNCAHGSPDVDGALT